MTIPSRAHTQYAFLKGIDSGCAVYKKIQPAFKKWVKQQQIGWIARYGPRKTGVGILHKFHSRANRDLTTLSVEEADFLRGKCGLMILPIQWKMGGGKNLNAATGKSMGEKMAKWAQAMGIPRGVHLWCDLEGHATKRAGIRKCQEYVNAWAAVVTSKNYGYKAGLYSARSLPRGWATQHLDALKGITCFWQCAQRTVPKPSMGCSIKQSSQTFVWLNHRKYTYDPDIIYPHSHPPVLWA